MKNLIDWKLFALLLCTGIFGVLAVFPYVLTTQASVFADIPLSIPVILAVSLVQTTVLLSISIFIGLWLGKQVGLGAPLLSKILKREPIDRKLRTVGLLSVSLGALAGILIIAFDFVFQFFMPPVSTSNVPLWQSFLASFYGGIVEELLLRFFLVTLLVWVLWRMYQKRNGAPSKTIVLIAIGSAAIIFGLGHLPATAALTIITPLVILRAIVLNGIGGIVFGWLFWKKGIEAAIIAHFTADIMLLVLFPIILHLVG